MIRSMTAFARSDYRGELGELTLELRGVNHRFLELNLRLPEELRQLEPPLRQQLQQQLGRGKIDLFLKYQPPTTTQQLAIDEALAAELARLSHQIDKLIYNPAPISSLELLQWPGVLQGGRLDKEALEQQLFRLLQQALQEFITTREAEGERLQQVILCRCDEMATVVEQLEQRLPEVVQLARQRLKQRLQELVSQQPDEGRLEQEMALVMQRLDIDEELQRLKSHLTELHSILVRNQPVGRRLDFLLQELNREANTIGSKSADLQTTQASVELKVIIEQVREQIQNIE
ncbi:YicC family protein [Ectothiorhodospiraceae bacterium BW-2]|nr:YicC family protein [Ectothiorhodospiraceae bacterium BW-2]